MNAVVFLADGFEEIEALTVVDYLRRAGVSVSTVAVPCSTMNCGNVVSAAHGVKVFADMTFGDFEKEYSARLPDAVYVPGGMPGALNVASCAQVLSFIEKCFAAGKYVSAICAAPAVVLSQTGVLRGKHWTCYPEMQNQYAKDVLADSTHIDDVPFVSDGTLVTGRGPGCTEQLAMELVRLLCGDEVCEKIRKASIQR